MELPRAIRAEGAAEPALFDPRAALRPLAAPRLRRAQLARLVPRRLARVALHALVALVLASLATLLSARWLEARIAAGTAAPARLEVRKVLVASRDLPPGTRLTARLLVPADWPAAAVRPDQYLPGDPRLAGLEGALLLAPVPAGAPLLVGHVAARAGEGLSALLGPGMRAIAIPVSASGAVAGLIAPGDRVDLLLTRTLPNGRTVTATVATAVRVLGLDQRLDPASPEDGGTVPATVTLEATPRQAEAIALLETLGRVTLALRRPDDPEQTEEAPRPPPAWDSDALSLPAAALAPAEAAAAAAGTAVAAPAPAGAAAIPAAPAAAPRANVERGVEQGVQVVRGSSIRSMAPAPAEAAP